MRVGARERIKVAGDYNRHLLNGSAQLSQNALHLMSKGHAVSAQHAMRANNTQHSSRKDEKKANLM